MTKTLALNSFLWLLPLAAFAAAPQERLGFDTTGEVARAASAYIAPENMILYRMRYPDGSYREFDHDFNRPDVLHGSGGWRGRVKGDKITVRTGPNVVGGRAEFVFKAGRLVSFAQGGKKTAFPYDMPREAAGGTNSPPYHFVDQQANRPGGTGKRGVKRRRLKMDKNVRKVFASKWRRSGRLQWPFANPNENGCLYASLALLACAFFFAKRRAAKIAGAALFLAASACLVMTASRGSFLALALGLVPVVALKAKVLVRSKAAWILAAIVALMAAGWFLTHDARLLTRGFGEVSWSNQVRLDMWSATPRMMVDAPGGWNFAHVGRAYMDWYQPLEIVSLPGSLMNDHLTRLVGWGWPGRFFYVFAWLAGLGILGVFAWRTRNAVALGSWLLFLVAGWFNPVQGRIGLWCAPVAALASCLCGRPWRGARIRGMACVAGISVLLAAALLGGVALAGKRRGGGGCPVKAEGNRVYVRGSNPRVWIVDDGRALGDVLACKEIRGYYRHVPSAEAVGYVRDVKHLPEKVHRLVLAGQSGADWMDWVRGMVESGKSFALPDEVIFISPTFPPSALPEGFLSVCKVLVAVGEFAAIYEPEYASPPPWAIVVPGMELYIDRWMDIALAR